MTITCTAITHLTYEECLNVLSALPNLPYPCTGQKVMGDGRPIVLGVLLRTRARRREERRKQAELNTVHINAWGERS